MKKKKLMIFLCIVLIVVALMFIIIKSLNSDFGKSKTDDDMKVNSNEQFFKEQKVDGLLISNIECNYDGKNSTVLYTIKNTTKKEIHIMEYQLIIKDKKKKILTTIMPNLDTKLAAGQEIPVSNQVNIDLSNAYQLEVKLLK